MTLKNHTKVAMLAAVALIGALGMIFASAAGANIAKPELSLRVTHPDSVQPGEFVRMPVFIVNMGNAPSHGPMTFVYTVPSGMTMPSSPEFMTSVEFPETPEEEASPAACTTVGSKLTCTIPEALPAAAQITVYLEFTIEPGATGTLVSTIDLSGGESAATSAEQRMRVGAPGVLAFTDFGASITGSDGQPSVPTVQAASDPVDFTTSFRFATSQSQWGGFFPIVSSVEDFKDVVAHLPAGLIGNPTAMETCTDEQLAYKPFAPEESLTACPVDSQIGVVRLSVLGSSYVAELFNLEAPPGFATELGFNVLGTVVALDAYVRPGDSGIDIVSRNTSTTVPVSAVEVTVWGDPEAHIHDRERGKCLRQAYADGQVCPVDAPEKTFLRLPTSCSGTGMPFSIESNSYTDPAREVSAVAPGPTLTGCERVPFNPSLDLAPTTSEASSDSGVAVHLTMPQTVNPEGLWQADLKKAVVTLPEGLTINPSAADGLQACTDAQLKVGLAGPSECPEASKVGYLELHTPLLANPIQGSIWLRTQNSSDPASGEMFRIALEFRDDLHGIDIKVPGQIAANPVTGQLTSTFDNAPQLPFGDLALHFKAGARSPLSTPASCGTKDATADLYSWAQPDVAVRQDASFQITSGAEGTSCASPSQFNPGFDAGVSSVQAGGFTPFLATFSRKDADQSMQRVSVELPRGLIGSLSNVVLCKEAQANAGTCGPESEIGTVTAGAGAGPTPYYVTGGKVFTTGPYEGAPYGLSVVVPAKAGPFDLGTVVVRAKIDVDPYTARLTVTTDPLPQIIGGVPVNLRLVNVTINRSKFTFNPTNCNPLSVDGTITGGQGATASQSNHFQVTNCGALGFKPQFKVSVSGNTSRANGASLDAKLSYPKGSLGKQANIARVKVSLPKQLPSRLTTLQKACPAQVFDANPSACPAASRIGTAVATTPAIPVGLYGPVYFVSHGGEAFPDLVVVLQGYGVTVDLVGSTFISKAGVTSTTFKTVPDVPVGTFELKLPQGKYSALAANGNLCTSKLKMPTAFVAQDGAEIHTTTPIVTTGCAKHKAKTKKKK